MNSAQIKQQVGSAVTMPITVPGLVLYALEVSI